MYRLRSQLVAFALTPSASVAGAQINTGEIGGVAATAPEACFPAQRSPQLMWAAAWSWSGSPISDVIENREVVQLPLDGRTFFALAQLSESVVIPPGGTRGEALRTGQPAAERRRPAIRPQYLPARRYKSHRRVVQQPGDQSVSRFDRGVQDSEVDVRSRVRREGVCAGANTFRGSAFEFHHDDAFDAPNYFRPVGVPVPPLGQDQFGGTLGGPLRRNRSFFFGGFEGLRMKRSLTRTFRYQGCRCARAISRGQERFATR